MLFRGESRCVVQTAEERTAKLAEGWVTTYGDDVLIEQMTGYAEGAAITAYSTETTTIDMPKRGPGRPRKVT